ncbi:MAG: curli assembly protein CsgF [Alphaproteobacteria bacterium]|nr:curli assembly protein CsgF [Alphaproteobacteria bacterium]
MTYRRTFRIALATAALACLWANASRASALVFQGQNAALFPNANPSDTAALMNSVVKPTSPTSTTSINPGTLILQSVESQISSQIYNDIFSGSAASGYYNLGGGNTISYLRANGEITITIVDPSNGTTTLTVPDVS